ncbi:MAG: 2-C-methyl-D-erythritol 4-phosphate cytidylyltransferase [Bacteroidota bacterium]
MIHSDCGNGGTHVGEREFCQVAAVVPAAGCGRRLGAGCSKALLDLAGRPLLWHAVRPLVESGWLDVLVVAGRAEELDRLEEILAPLGALPLEIALVPGGAERSDSVRAGLVWLSAWTGWTPGVRRLVAVHDAARPFLSAALWRNLVLAAARDGAAIPGYQTIDTLKHVDAEGKVVATVQRDGLYQVQTPQVFEFEPFLAAHLEHPAGSPATDDARIWEETGRPVTLLPGERINFKITTEEDLLLAELLLRGRGGVDADWPRL